MIVFIKTKLITSETTGITRSMISVGVAQNYRILRLKLAEACLMIDGFFSQTRYSLMF